MSEIRTAKGRLEIRQSLSADGEGTLLRLSGSIDETFTGFDALPASTTSVVLELSGLTRITSYGVRQWIHGRDQLSTAAKQVYYLNCPPVFIDQLNMVLNFGGRGLVITAMAPFSCNKCHREERPLIDVLKDHDDLVAGRVASVPCSKCGTPMEMDELPETYFNFVKTAGARGVTPATAALLAQNDLYNNAPIATEGPALGDRASVQKLVHDRVTYFRVGGTIDKRFRARALLEGTEGEVVLDLRELSGVADDSREEWERLRAGLVQRASVVTVLDVPPAILDAVAKGLSLNGTVVYSILAPYKCDGCGRRADEPIILVGPRKSGPANAQRVCPVCGGANRFVGKPEHGKLAAILPTGALAAATREVIERRDDLLSRARIEAESTSLPATTGRSGTILGKYEIVRAISVGGMAEVFLAVQKGIGGFAKPVALKRIRRSVLEHRHFAVEQFLNEAKIAATLAHPNIAQIFDVGEEDGVLYLAMEFVHGRDLRAFGKRLRDGESGTPVPLAMALYVVRQIALALHHAYTTLDLNGRQLKAIHRDVSPHNILCGFDGTIKLVDFGVATSAATARHDPTAMAGKRHYIAPEQLMGEPLDARSDLFSLGVVLYELLTGQRPFKQESQDASQTTANTGAYKPVSQLRPDLGASAGAGIDAMIGKLLATKPSDRFSDGNKLADEITRFAAQQNVTLSGDWLRTTMPTLFPMTGDEVDAEGAAIDTTHTPRSNSFSLSPTVDRMRHAATEEAPPVSTVATPAGTPIAAPLRPPAARAASPASPRTPTPQLAPTAELDEQTMSRILAAAPKPRSRVLYVLVLAAAVAALVLLWTRY